MLAVTFGGRSNFLSVARDLVEAKNSEGEIFSTEGLARAEYSHRDVVKPLESL